MMRTASKWVTTGGATLALGICLGIVVAELGIGLYYERLMWLPYAIPPAYVDDSDKVRFALLGGSTSAGAPYSSLQDVNFNLLSPLELLLRERYGHHNVAIDSYAWHGWTAEQTVAAYWREAKHKPDVLVIYTGQNEGNHYDGWNLIPHRESLWETNAARTNIGDLLLRSWFRLQRSGYGQSIGLGVRPASADDGEPPQYRPFQPYELKFPSWSLFDAPVVPSYERRFNARHFELLLDSVLLHAEREGIVPILIIPEGNFLYPPAVSVYDGPLERRAEAITKFKRALYWKHFGGDLNEARRLLEHISAFCSFSRLHYELGELLYRQGHLTAAKPILRKAMDTDAQPLTISRRHRAALQRLADKHGLVAIDMHQVVTAETEAVPGDAAFHDAVHLRLPIYEALSREILRRLRADGFEKLALTDMPLPISREERARAMGLTAAVIHHSMAAQGRWFEVTAEHTFFKLGPLQQAIGYVRTIAVANDAPAKLAELAAQRVILLETRLEEARAHMLAWIEDNGGEDAPG